MIDCTPARLGRNELGACLDLARRREWPRETATWELLFDLGQVYGLRTSGGRLVATIAIMSYDNEVATLGGLLVAPDHDGQGIGRFLTEFALATTPATSVWLTATAQARRLYERLGFRRTGICRRYRGTLVCPTAPLPSFRDVRESDLPAMTALDGLAFGVARTAAISTVFSMGGHSVISIRNDQIAGFALTWRSMEETVIGPLIAKDDAPALDMLAHLAKKDIGPVRLELLLPEHATIAEWMADNGMRAQQDTDVMVRGNELPGVRRWLVSPITRALG